MVFTRPCLVLKLNLDELENESNKLYVFLVLIFKLVFSLTKSIHVHCKTAEDYDMKNKSSFPLSPWSHTSLLLTVSCVSSRRALCTGLYHMYVNEYNGFYRYLLIDDLLVVH